MTFGNHLSTQTCQKICKNIEETDDDGDYKSDEEETNDILDKISKYLSIYPSIACRFGIK